MQNTTDTRCFIVFFPQGSREKLGGKKTRLCRGRERTRRPAKRTSSVSVSHIVDTWPREKINSTHTPKKRVQFNPPIISCGGPVLFFGADTILSATRAGKQPLLIFPFFPPLRAQKLVRHCLSVRRRERPTAITRSPRLRFDVFCPSFSFESCTLSSSVLFRLCFVSQPKQKVR